jgi:methionyl-tRNA synthetase
MDQDRHGAEDASAEQPLRPVEPLPPALPRPTPPPPPTEPPPEPEETRELLGIEEFQRWDLRVARVIAAEPHPRATRLLKLRVDLGGGDERPLVAGIAGQYRPEDLVGRCIVVVANLKPARLRGEESRGMLLAASCGEVISLLVPDRELPPGAPIR